MFENFIEQFNSQKEKLVRDDIGGRELKGIEGETL